MSLMRCHDCDGNIDTDYNEMFSENQCMKCRLNEKIKCMYCDTMIFVGTGSVCKSKRCISAIKWDISMQELDYRRGK